MVSNLCQVKKEKRSLNTKKMLVKYKLLQFTPSDNTFTIINI